MTFLIGIKTRFSLVNKIQLVFPFLKEVIFTLQKYPRNSCKFIDTFIDNLNSNLGLNLQIITEYNTYTCK